MKKTLLSLSFIIGMFTGNAQVLLYEGFDYAVGDSLPMHGWTGINNGDKVFVTSGSLSYTGFAPSVGNKISFDGAGRDFHKTFTSQAAGIVYMSFIFQVTDASLLDTVTYFTGVGASSLTFGSTVWIRKSGIGFNIGFNARSTVAYNSWDNTVYDFNTPILIVVSYQIVSGTTNDIANMWINPNASSFGATTEPTPTITITNGGTDLTAIDRIFVRQAAINSTPFLDMDEIRVDLTWANVTPAFTGSAPVADFMANTTTITEGGSVDFTDLSAGSPTQWNWQFAVGAVSGTCTPATSSLQNKTVVYNLVGIYTVKLTATNIYGSDIEEKIAYITVNPAATLTATSSANPTSICAGVQSQLNAVPDGGSGSYSYEWSSNPAGFNSIVQNPTVYPTVTTTYSVVVTSGSQTATSSVVVDVNPLPANAGTISGVTTVCQGQNSVIYAVPTIANATSYVWILPSGAIGTSSTNSITVYYGMSAVSGGVEVYGQNICGNGNASILAVLVNIKPSTPTIILNGNILNSDATTGNQWYNQNGLIAGAINQNYTPTIDGVYYVIITTNGCSSDPSNTINVITGVELTENNKTINVYPNPVTNKIFIKNSLINKNEIISIYNVQGQLLLKQPMQQEKIEINISGFAKGVYVLKIESEEGIAVKRIVKE